MGEPMGVDGLNMLKRANPTKMDENWGTPMANRKPPLSFSMFSAVLIF